MLPHRAGPQGIVVPREHEDRTGSPVQQVRHPLHHPPVHPRMLEQIPRHQQELRSGLPGRPHHPLRRSEPLLPDPGSAAAQMSGPHPHLPVSGVQKPHGVPPLLLVYQRNTMYFMPLYSPHPGLTSPPTGRGGPAEAGPPREDRRERNAITSRRLVLDDLKIYYDEEP